MKKYVILLLLIASIGANAQLNLIEVQRIHDEIFSGKEFKITKKIIDSTSMEEFKRERTIRVRGEFGSYIIANVDTVNTEGIFSIQDSIIYIVGDQFRIISHHSSFLAKPDDPDDGIYFSSFGYRCYDKNNKEVTVNIVIYHQGEDFFQIFFTYASKQGNVPRVRDSYIIAR